MRANMGWNDVNTTMCANSARVFLLQGEGLVKYWSKQSLLFLSTYMAPCTVNLALACELYFKALLSGEHNGQAPKTHHLQELFDELQSQTQSEIKAEYTTFSTLLSFDNCILTHDNAFVEWRYYYEGNKNSISGHPPSLYYLALSLNHIYSKREANP